MCALSRRAVVVVVATIVAAMFALAVPGKALACTHDDTHYFDSFVDATCLQPPLSNGSRPPRVRVPREDQGLPGPPGRH
jgi:hypothetical protein